MMKTISSDVLVPVWVLLVLVFGPLEAHAQAIPPITPAIKSETGVRQIQVSNASQGAPVEVSASMRLSDHVYGDGFMRLKSVSESFCQEVCKKN